MYKELTASDLKAHSNLESDYNLDGFIVYGTWNKDIYDVFLKVAMSLDPSITHRYLTRFLEPILEIKIKEKTLWFAAAYGGAILSEFTHLACLFGSKKNIVVGVCGGLFPDANNRDIIIPTYSQGDESSTRAYNPVSDNRHYPSEELSLDLLKILEAEHKVWRGPTVTYQAMLGETKEDVDNWSTEGYYGVDMETSTVFAVSKHFNIPAAAMLAIADNLVKGETVVDVNYEVNADRKGKRVKVKEDTLRAAINTALL